MFRAQTFVNSVGTVLSTFDGSPRKESYCVSIPHSYIAHPKHSVVCGYRRHTREFKYNFDESKKFKDETRPSHANFSGWKNLRNYDEQFTSSTSPNTFRSLSRRHGNYESDDHALGIC